MRPSAKDINYRAVNALLTLLISTARRLPYELRVRLCGWIGSRVLGPLTGGNRRAGNNLKYIFPDWPAANIQRVARESSDNYGRAFIEFYSTRGFEKRTSQIAPEGPGLKAVEKAQCLANYDEEFKACYSSGDPEPGRDQVKAMEAAKGKRQAVILVSGHFGNFQAIRSCLAQRGYICGALYRRMNNPYFETHYRKVVERISPPAFERFGDQRELLRFLRLGGMLGWLNDQHFEAGEGLDFMGKPAKTSITVARIACRHNALLVPVYGTRARNGIDIEVFFEDPIPHGDPSEMTQALNDSLADRIRKNPGQWLWAHERWKSRP